MEKKDKYIPINKGHSTLDTNERIQNFEKISQADGKMNTKIIDECGMS